MSGTTGTTTALTSSPVPLVPVPFCRVGPQKPNDYRLVPPVPLVPVGNVGPAVLAAAFETAFAIAEPHQQEVREPAPDLDAFEERAAIAEHNGGLGRSEAEALAASEQGFETPADLVSAAVAGWRVRLEALVRTETSPRGRDCIAQALRFIADGWAGTAALLGWSELELFGADPCAPWERLDRLGAAYSMFTPGAVTADTIIYPGTGSTPMRRYRGSQADGAHLTWETKK